MTAERSMPELQGRPRPPAEAPGAQPARPAGGHSLDPQLAVKFAALGICHSNHAVHCGLTVILAGHAPEPVAATDDLPVRVDWLQHEVGQGPGVRPVLGEVVVSKDLADDGRWPDFGRLCVAVLDLRSMVCLQIPLGAGNRALLSFYSSDPAALDRLDVDAARRLGRLTAPALDSLIDEFGGQLPRAPRDNSSLVATALGMVVARYRVRSPEAFDLLLAASHLLNRPLLDVALEVATEGCLPETAAGRLQTWDRNPTGPGHDVRPHRGRADIPQIGGPELWGHPDPSPAPRGNAPRPGPWRKPTSRPGQGHLEPTAAPHRLP